MSPLAPTVTQGAQPAPRRLSWRGATRDVSAACPGGEIGRRKGLKIPWEATPVQVRVLPRALRRGRLQQCAGGVVAWLLRSGFHDHAVRQDGGAVGMDPGEWRVMGREQQATPLRGEPP